MKQSFIYCMIFACTSLPSTVFAYGEGGDIPYGSRALHLLTNEARTDFYHSLRGCLRNVDCKEVDACIANYDKSTGECKKDTSCYPPAQHPLYWNDTVYRAADFHANLNSNYIYCYGHFSPCDVSESIGVDYPEKCDGSPSCACKDGDKTKLKCDYKDANGNTIGVAARMRLFIDHKSASRGEIMSYGPVKYPEMYRPYYMFYKWLFETGDVSECKATSSNGHRHHLGFSVNPHKDYWFEDNHHHSVGIGYRLIDKMPDSYVAVEDFSTITTEEIVKLTKGNHPSISNIYRSALSAGSHYLNSQVNGELWFKTHYYANTPAKKVVMSLGNQCYSLKRTVGTDKNGIYGTSSLHPDGECLPYFYEVVDTNGKKDRFPTTGSLLYNCEKSWEKSATKSCLNDLNCKADEHEYNGKCEKDSIDDCGIHGYACTDIKFWGTGKCANGQCELEKCATGSHFKDETIRKNVLHSSCVADSITACGAEGYKCAEKAANWKGGICTGGKCFATSCQTNFHPENGACVSNTAGLSCTKTQHEFNKACKDDDVNNCGAEGYKCADRVTGWASGQCTNKKCVLETCKDGYKYDTEKKTCARITTCTSNQHIYNNACEDNSITNCGSHGYVCKDNVADWKSGSCSGGKCVISECANGKVIKDGQCVEKTTECTSKQHKYGSGCETNSVENCGEHGKTCATVINGWQDGSCPNGECLVSACANGKHIENNACIENTIDCSANEHEYSGSCEDNTIDNCGSHNNKCADRIKGWSEGTCTDAVCVATECSDDYELSDGNCIEKIQYEDIDSDYKPISEDCSATTNHPTTKLPLWLIGLLGFGLYRRRKSHHQI